ncbi:hypothetical protein BU24DRAFT_427341 [Aaosphaeria arxii CBS 175.79]|uniref:F-box domain-containing protein n=1 Tax=Aaosphaeria arxii CBS 175.79 TaxID=1450172 RepID=A0A6A5XE34_9PLEO|nr:uncharacterized protein BU24DRAFT_427341 [Aaosphaeria arxii CBS 175.79]KAF2011131.1 hypothetical protein BU24DRAFT_427341 [Aaosphaeria arxii CBS 175.79]
MASQVSTPRSNSRSRSHSQSSTTSEDSSDTTMLETTPLTPVRPRPLSHSNPATPAARTSAKDPTFSLLLSLPRELRNRIYSYALISQYPFWWPNPAPVKHDISLGLLTTSRQVYDEAAPILYAKNKFLFTHPSDCNIFRIISSPKYSALMSAVYFRFRERDLRLWTTYLGSRSKDRSLEADLPKLKSLWIFLKCGAIGQASVAGGGHHGVQGGIGLPPALAAQVHAVQNALGQQVQALQQQVQNLNQAIAAAAGQGNAPPMQQGPFPGAHAGDANPDHQAHPPVMSFHQFAAAFPAQGQAHQLHHLQQQHHHHHHPPPGQPHAHGVQNNPPNISPLAQMAQQHHQHNHDPQHHPQPHGSQGNGQDNAFHGTFYNSFFRWERELGLENLCLSLQETRPAEADVKIVCIMRLPKPEVGRLCRLYPEELSVDRNGDARTRFRKLHGVEVSLEISGFDLVP